MQREPVDLERLPAQWLSAHGNTEGAMWVYDAAAELKKLRAIEQRARQLATGSDGGRDARQAALYIVGEA